MTRHDLPPRWDDYRVEWDGWNTGAVGFVCPPPKHEPCTVCRSLAEPAVNHGNAWSRPGEYRPYAKPRDYGQVRANAAADRDGVILASLWASRCPACGHDTVTVFGTTYWPAEPETWDLDPSDYGDEGSHITQETLL